MMMMMMLFMKIAMLIQVVYVTAGDGCENKDYGDVDNGVNGVVDAQDDET